MNAFETVGLIAVLFFFLIGIATFGNFAWRGYQQTRKEIEAGQHDIERGIAH